MAKSVAADITPEVLVWARKTVNLGTEEAAHGIGVEETTLKEWEAGSLKPTVVQLKTIANYYKRPLATFFLSTPPPDTRPPKDFRRSRENELKPYSKTLSLAIRSVELRRDFAKEMREEAEFKPLAFIGSASMRTDPAKLAAQVRKDLLRVDLDEQQSWKGAREAFHEWLDIFEGLGILVFQTPGISPQEMRGFSMQDKIAPAVVANAKDTWAARSFTLMHELSHLLLDNPGVCDLEERAQDRTDEGKVEVYCNAFAGHLLVPGDALKEAIKPVDTGRIRAWSDDELHALAATFRVSREVVLRRLLSMGRASEAFYNEKREQFAFEYAMLAELKKKSKKKRGFLRPHKRSVRDNGKSFTRLALNAYADERITGNELLDYLGVKMEYLPGVRGEL